MSSEGQIARGSNMITKRESKDYPLSSYETAMEKLSSLITGQKRGDQKRPIADRFEKMMMYLKVLLKYMPSMFE